MEFVKFPKWMGQYPRLCAPWCPEEESELRRGWEYEKLTIPQLAKKHGRGIGGIESRLMQLYGWSWDELERQRNRRYNPPAASQEPTASIPPWAHTLVRIDQTMNNLDRRLSFVESLLNCER